MWSSNPFVAINSVQCRPEYVPRFKELFTTRAGAIDRMPGFIDMAVLEPKTDGEPYLIISRWQDESTFQAWTKSPEFMEGHKRAFADLKMAKERGEELPMHSSFETYSVLTT